MGEADCLVAGDRDLLEMSPFDDIPILTGLPFCAAGPPSAALTRYAPATTRRPTREG